METITPKKCQKGQLITSIVINSIYLLLSYALLMYALYNMYSTTSSIGKIKFFIGTCVFTVLTALSIYSIVADAKEMATYCKE